MGSKPDPLSRRAVLKASFSTAVVGLFFGAGGCSGDEEDAARPGCGPLNPDACVDGGGVCTNSCLTANDGICDDGAAGAIRNTCVYGTDCGDCGSRTSVATYSDGYGYYDYVDSYYDYYGNSYGDAYYNYFTNSY
jgi:hypothetical protein